MTTATKERKRKVAGITLDYGAFTRAVKIASHAVPSRAASAVTGSLCIGNGLVSGCTPGEYRIDVDLMEAQCEPVLLPKERLLKILHNAEHTDVQIVPEGAMCAIRIGSGEWRLPTENAAEFPAWEPTGLHSMPSLPGDEFARAVKHVIYAIDKDSTRYALNGVLIEVIDDAVFFVATDGRRVSVAKCRHDIATDDFVREPTGTKKPAPIIPTQALTQLANQCGGDLTVSMQCGGGAFVASVGDVTVTAAAIQGRFPNWQSIFPKDLPPANAVSRELLQAAVLAASVVTSQSSYGVRFRFHDGALTLTAKSSEGGESEIACDVGEYSTDADVTLDPKFITQFLKPFDKDSEPCVMIRVCDGEGKTVLDVGEEYRGVVMPLSGDA